MARLKIINYRIEKKYSGQCVSARDHNANHLGRGLFDNKNRNRLDSHGSIKGVPSVN